MPPQEPINIQEPQTAERKNKLPKIWPLASAVMAVVIVVMTLLWKPWQSNPKASDRTIDVTGSATIKAEPDEYSFTPSYRFTGSNKTATQQKLTDKANRVTTKLKGLGVPDSAIKNNSYSYGNYYPVSSGSDTYNLSLTITVDNKALAQKVQNYLLTTNPSGQITPSVSFSTAKQKTLQNQARDKAEQDARANADQSAKNLGFKVEAVKSVKDSGFNNFGGCSGGFCPLYSGANSATDLNSSQSLSLQPGLNDLSYSVSVVYYIH